MTFVSLLAVVVVLLLAPDAHADSLLYVADFTVHDATGRRIGTAWPTSDGVYEGHGPGGFMVVEFRSGSTPVILRFTEDGFRPDWLLYTGRGCTGLPMINPSDRRPQQTHDLTAVAGPRSTLYVQAGQVRDRTARSYVSPDGVCTDYDEPRTASWAAARATALDLADHFVPPFQVRTRAGGAVPRGAP